MIGIFEDDGGDTYDLLSEVWDAVVTGGDNGTIAINASAGRNATYGLLVTVTHGGVNGAYVQKNIPTLTTAYVGFGFEQDFLSSPADAGIVAFLDGATTQVDLRCDTSGHLYFTRNGTQIGAKSVNAIAFGVYHWIELKVTIDPSAGVAEVRVNGSSAGWLALSAQN